MYFGPEWPGAEMTIYHNRIAVFLPNPIIAHGTQGIV